MSDNRYIEIGAGWNKSNDRGAWVSWTIDADKVAEAAKAVGKKKFYANVWTEREKKNASGPDFRFMVTIPAGVATGTNTASKSEPDIF